MPGPTAALDTPVSHGQTAFQASKNPDPGIRQPSDPLWRWEPIDGTRWNQLYPYQLLVVESIPGPKDEITYRTLPGWWFTLPMAPEAWDRDTSFASSVSAQAHGVLEEHNGVVFKQINLRGTCGVLPLRGTAEVAGTPTPLASIFGGTITAAQNTAGAAAGLRDGVTSEGQVSANTYSTADFDGTELSKSSGYYQTLLLERFLEAYATAKKTRRFRNYHLAFAVWKERSVFLVKPTNFRVSKASGSPLESTYSLSMTAWARIRLDTSGSGLQDPGLPIKRNPGLLAQVLNTVRDARRVLEGVRGVASAAVGDLDRLVTEPLRQTGLFAKDLLGTKRTVFDLPADLRKIVLADFVNTSKAVVGFSTTDTTGDLNKRRLNAASDLSTQGKLTPGDWNPSQTEWMDAVGLDDIRMTPKNAAAVRKASSDAAATTRDQFEARGSVIRRTADVLAVALGAGDPTYQDLYGVHPTALKDIPTSADWETLFAISDAAEAMDSLAAAADPQESEPGMEAMAALARKSGIAFRIPVSKFAVPFPYRGTLEGLAATYLGDPMRWLEIAELNGLRAPWIDETGWSVPLVANSVDREVSISDSGAPEIWRGQTVYIMSSAQRRTHRRVEGVKRTAGTLTLLLDKAIPGYLVADQAVLEGFLPDTVNSQQLIYIPSEAEPSQDPAVTKSIPGIQEFDPMVATGGVDLLLDSDHDLVVTPDGDQRLAVGLTNVVQSWGVDLATPLGSLLLHPMKGRPQVVGKTTAEIDPKEQLEGVRRMFAEDPAVASIDSLSVVNRGPVARTSATVTLRGVKQPIPVTYDVKTGFQPPVAVD